MKTGNHSQGMSFSHFAQAALVCGAVWAGMVTDMASARPKGEHVVRGNVSFERDGNRTIIRASDGSIINYANFDIAHDELVRFIQPGEWARVLNRINSAEPTMIQGTLLANGRVYIVNPSGVMFGQGAVVDVAGIYAAGGNLTDSRFINGVDRFTDLDGAVINEGTIRGNAIHLIGDQVANHGRLVANRGIITMLAGNDVIIREHGERIIIKVDGARLTNQARPHDGSTTPDMTATPGVENTGTVKSNVGTVVLGAGDMYALAVRNSGNIIAKRGDVTLAAADGLVQNSATGSITTDVKRGTAGDITMQGPSVLQQGRLSADSHRGQAGSVEVTSQNHTYITDGSLITAEGGRGNADGGEVLVHSYDGLTVMANGARIDVSGGRTGGEGGFAEVSGDRLTYNGYTDLNAKRGSSKGTLLLDPNNLTVNDTGGDDAFLADGIIMFDEPNTTTNIAISDEALEALTGTIILQATGDIIIEHPVHLVHFNDVTLEAEKNVFIYEPIHGMNNFSAFADVNGSGFGVVLVTAPLVIGGNAVFNGQNTFLNSFTLDSVGSQTFLGPVDLCVDMVLTATDVHFQSTVNATVAGEQSLTINGPSGPDGVAVFDGEVGGMRKLESLRVNGTSDINGGLVVTKDFQRYFGDVTLGSDTHMITTDAGEIRFAERLNGAHNLLIETAGLTRFDGTGGGVDPLLSVTTDAPGTTLLAGDMSAGVIDYNDPVTLGDDVTLDGSTSVDFAQTIAGGRHDLIINSPLTGFHGNATALGLLRTDADGLTNIEANITGLKLDFNDPVMFLSDSVLAGRDFVDFDQTTDGFFDVTTNSERLVRFGGNVGSTTALASLTTNVGSSSLVDSNLVIIDARLVRVVGDITFNPAGRSRPAEVATIAARNSSGVRIRSLSGNIHMGPNEKLTSLGDLSLEALNGSMTLGDLNAFGDITAMSDDIRLRARRSGRLLDSSGRLIDDDGAEYIARGSITFSSTPTVIGSGDKPVFATASGSGVNSRLSGFDAFAFSGLSASDFTFGGLVLDLTPPPTGTELAPALTAGPARVDDRILLDPFALRPMDRLAIYMRAYRDDELRGTVTGREFADSSTPPGSAADQHLVPTHRLRRDAVLAVIDQYLAMFVQISPGDSPEDVVEVDQSEHIRTVLASAWDAYSADAGDAASPDGFRDYLESAEDHIAARDYVDGLRILFHEMWVMGVTPLELRNSLNGLLGPITPQSMQQAQLEEAIEANTLG